MKTEQYCHWSGLLVGTHRDATLNIACFSRASLQAEFSDRTRLTGWSGALSLKGKEAATVSGVILTVAWLQVADAADSTRSCQLRVR